MNTGLRCRHGPMHLSMAARPELQVQMMHTADVPDNSSDCTDAFKLGSDLVEACFSLTYRLAYLDGHMHWLGSHRHDNDAFHGCTIARNRLHNDLEARFIGEQDRFTLNLTKGPVARADRVHPVPRLPERQSAAAPSDAPGQLPRIQTLPVRAEVRAAQDRYRGHCHAEAVRAPACSRTTETQFGHGEGQGTYDSLRMQTQMQDHDDPYRNCSSTLLGPPTVLWLTQATSGWNTVWSQRQ
ncbi:hypothetical protein EVG20_g7451 [Dentipellis fragilis]|uniref:Uncharacterized protein n=1 Tax=Dentipellis fragilis TaxID=205917 RepID=A0A4Y9YEA4_9AGAM|nr:hypothetical protein EVG20_g7451 [Dentipellis fragilis]